MNKKSRTDFLFPTPSFLYGAATVFDLSGSFYEYNGSEIGEEADKVALEQDFNVIGQDLSKAFREEINSLAA